MKTTTQLPSYCCKRQVKSRKNNHTNISSVNNCAVPVCHTKPLIRVKLWVFLFVSWSKMVTEQMRKTPTAHQSLKNCDLLISNTVEENVARNRANHIFPTYEHYGDIQGKRIQSQKVSPETTSCKPLIKKGVSVRHAEEVNTIN